MSESLDAYYKKRRVYIPESDRQIEFLDRGFGIRRGKKLELSPYEAFFLTEKKRIKVIDENTITVESIDGQSDGNAFEIYHNTGEFIAE